MLRIPSWVTALLDCDGNPELLFTENESNAERLWGQPNATQYVKDAFHDYVVSGNQDAVDPSKVGTKTAAYYRLKVPGGGSKSVRLRLSAKPSANPFGTFDQFLLIASQMPTSSTPESLQAP